MPRKSFINVRNFQIAKRKAKKWSQRLLRMKNYKRCTRFKILTVVCIADVPGHRYCAPEFPLLVSSCAILTEKKTMNWDHSTQSQITPLQGKEEQQSLNRHMVAARKALKLRCARKKQRLALAITAAAASLEGLQTLACSCRWPWGEWTTFSLCAEDCKSASCRNAGPGWGSASCRRCHRTKGK